MATIGELIINLKTDTAAFASDLKRVSNLSFETSRQIQRSFAIIGTAAVGAISAAAVGAAAMAGRAIDTADKMGKMAQSTGLSVEQFSALSYAAKLSDVETGTLSASLVILSKNLEKSSLATLEGKAAHSALATLFRGNIPVFSTTQQAFETIAERLSKLPDGFQKSALAAQIFGRNGAALIPLINDGAEGIHKAAEEAANFGMIVSTQTAKSADEFNDKIKALTTLVDGFGMRLAEALLPYLTRAADAMMKWAKSAGDMQLAAATAKASVQVLATALVVFYDVARLAGDATAIVVFALNAMMRAAAAPISKKGMEDFKFAVIELGASLKQTVDHQVDSAHLLSAIWAPLNAPAPQYGPADPRPAAEAASAAAAAEAAAAATAAAAAQQKAVQSIIDKLKEEIAAIGLVGDAAKHAEAVAKGANTGELAQVDALIERMGRLKLAFDLSNQLTFGNFPQATQEQIAGLDALQQRLNNLKLKPPADLAQQLTPGKLFPAIQPEHMPIQGELDQTFQFGADGIEEWNKKLAAEAKQITDENTPAIEKYTEAMAHLHMLQVEYKLSAEVVTGQEKKLAEQFGVSAEKVSAMHPVVLQVRQDMSEMFTQAIFRADSFRAAIGNVLERMAEMIFQIKVMQPLMDNLFGQQSKGGGWLSSLIGAVAGVFRNPIFGGGKVLSPTNLTGGLPLTPQPFTPLMGYASGGDVSAGVPIMVGENGPEPFIPKTSGTIIPNGALGDRVVFAPVYNIDARGAAPGSEAAISRALKDSEDRTFSRVVGFLDQRQARRA